MLRALMSALWRNREFVLLQLGQLLSSAGTASTTIAYPLLALALTHSPAKAGIISFTRLIPYALFGLASGLAADRWNRKRLMIAADAVRAAAVGALAAAIVLGRAEFWQIPIVAFLEGTAATFFGTSQAGALRAMIPAGELPAAVGAQRMREASVNLAGPPFGGALFGLCRSIPFVFDAASYLASVFSLARLRTPFQEKRELDRSRLRAQLAEGFRFLWGSPFIRTTAALYGLGNFILPGVFLVIIVVGKRQGLAAGEIGGLLAIFGAFLLLGSLLSPLFRRAFSTRAILLLEVWAGVGCAVFLTWTSVYVLAAAVLPQALVMASTDSVVVGYRVAMTPDRLLGRVESIRSTISRLIEPLGPLTAGVLLSLVSARTTIAFFVLFAVVLAGWATLSPAIRNAPSLEDLGTLGPKA
jgi:Transmembrane secretion effector